VSPGVRITKNSNTAMRGPTRTEIEPSVLMCWSDRRLKSERCGETAGADGNQPELFLDMLSERRIVVGRSHLPDEP
jgi:hypothetical protein